MKTSNAGLAEIAGHEGIVLSPYLDSVGIWTWGIGHTAMAGAPDPSRMPKALESSVPEIMAQFRKDMEKYEAEVRRAVAVPLQQHEFDALVSFHFNTGGIGRAAITRNLNAGNKALAIASFDNWHKPPEIKGRRDREKALFARGTYAHAGMASIYPANAAGAVQWSKGRRVNVLALIAGSPPSTSPVQPGHDAGTPETAGDPSPAPTGFLAALVAFLRSIPGIGRIFGG